MSNINAQIYDSSIASQPSVLHCILVTRLEFSSIYKMYDAIVTCEHNGVAVYTSKSLIQEGALRRGLVQLAKQIDEMAKRDGVKLKYTDHQTRGTATEIILTLAGAAGELKDDLP